MSKHPTLFLYQQPVNHQLTYIEYCDDLLNQLHQTKESITLLSKSLKGTLPLPEYLHTSNCREHHRAQLTLIMEHLESALYFPEAQHHIKLVRRINLALDNAKRSSEPAKKNLRTRPF